MLVAFGYGLSWFDSPIGCFPSLYLGFHRIDQGDCRRREGDARTGDEVEASHVALGLTRQRDQGAIGGYGQGGQQGDAHRGAHEAEQ